MRTLVLYGLGPAAYATRNDIGYYTIIMTDLLRHNPS
jgi:hypothetical protein